jgi:hypothetical protein
MEKPRTKKRWVWLGGALGLTAILVIVQTGTGRSRKMKTA